MSHPFTSTLLEEIGRELGLPIELEPRFRQAGVITLSGGRRSYFRLSTIDCNRSGAAKIAADKDYASYFMQRLGFPVPVGKAFFSHEWCVVNKTSNDTRAALAYAEELGFPVMVKPNSKAQGIGVTKVYTQEELRLALEAVFLIDPIALVQRVVPGRDYRLIVYKDSVPIAYERIPLTIIGNGHDTVHELLLTHLIALRARGRNILFDANDRRIVQRLQSMYSYTQASIPRGGERVQLLDNANMSAGGEGNDITETLHPTYRERAVAIARDMGLTLTGVDVMTTEDITQPLGTHTIIEINDRPGLEHYSALGAVQRARVKALYTRVLMDLESG